MLALCLSLWLGVLLVVTWFRVSRGEKGARGIGDVGCLESASSLPVGGGAGAFSHQLLSNRRGFVTELMFFHMMREHRPASFLPKLHISLEVNPDSPWVKRGDVQAEPDQNKHASNRLHL